MEAHNLERLIDALQSRRLRSLEGACGESPLNCLNDNELAVLQVLGGSALTMGRLAEESGIPMSTLTGITDKLVGKGLMERRRDEGDRRVVKVGLSPEGRSAWDDRLEKKHEICHNILSRLSPEEGEEFLRLLEKVVRD